MLNKTDLTTLETLDNVYMLKENFEALATVVENNIDKRDILFRSPTGKFMLSYDYIQTFEIFEIIGED
jgi:hypothetical protein